MTILHVDSNTRGTKKTCATNVFHQLLELSFGPAAFAFFIISFIISYVRFHDALSLASW